MPISTYSVPELLHKWRRDELTVEQMVGYLLQRLNEVEQRLRQLEQAGKIGRS